MAELKPGSYHVMLIDLKAPLKEGEAVPLTLSFDDGSTRTYTETTATQLQSGDRVKLENGRLVML